MFQNILRIILNKIINWVYKNFKFIKFAIILLIVSTETKNNVTYQ